MLIGIAFKQFVCGQAKMLAIFTSFRPRVLFKTISTSEGSVNIFVIRVYDVPVADC